MSQHRYASAAAALALIAAAGSSRAQPPDPGVTRDFVEAATQSDDYEINAAQVALVESQSDEVRAFAKRMIEDHTQTGAALRRALQASGMTPPPPSLGGDGQHFLASLQSLSGSEFDKAYLRQQVLAHKQALVVEQAYAAAGRDGDVRTAAQAAVPLIERHLEMARRLQAVVDKS
jgi:putative membrane protein